MASTSEQIPLETQVERQRASRGGGGPMRVGRGRGGRGSGERGRGGRGRGGVTVGGRDETAGPVRGGVRGGARGRGSRGKAPAASTLPHQETLEERKERMQRLIDSLTEEEAKEMLGQVAQQQPGIVFDLLDKVTPSQPGYHPPPGTTGPSWCI